LNFCVVSSKSLAWLTNFFTQIQIAAKAAVQNQAIFLNVS